MRLALVLAAALVAGCDAAGPVATDAPLRVGGLSLTADRDAYRRGETVRLALANESAGEVTTGVLECATLERWSGRAWEASHVGNDRACILLARILAPGERATGGVPLARVPDGSYRLAQQVTLASGRSATVATGTFRVD